MTTDEKRLALIEMCRIGLKSPYNDCGMCRISGSCRKTGHPPEYMKDDAVEMVYNDAVQVKAYKIGMTVREMRNELTRVCDLVTVEDCLDGVCPIDESCEKCRNHIPENVSADEIRIVYADLVRLGKFKED